MCVCVSIGRCAGRRPEVLQYVTRHAELFDGARIELLSIRDLVGNRFLISLIKSTGRKIGGTRVENVSLAGKADATWE